MKYPPQCLLDRKSLLDRKNEKWLAGSFFLASAALIGAASLLFLLRYRWFLPFSDQWQDLLAIKTCLVSWNGCEIENLFSFHNQHMITLTRLLHLAEYRWFGGKNIFLSGVSFLALLAMVMIVLKGCLALHVSAYDRLMTGCFAIIFILNPANIYNCLHSFNVQWMLCFIFGGGLIGNFVRHKGNLTAIQFFCFTGALLSTAGFLAILPTLAVLFFLFDKKKPAVIAALLAPVVTAAYLYAGSVLLPVIPGSANSPDLSGLSGHFIAGILRSGLILMGSIFFQWGDGVALVAGAAILGVFGINGLFLLKHRLQQDAIQKEMVFLFGLALFAFFMLWETAFARPYQTGDYRFCIQSSVFWFANAVLLGVVAARQAWKIPKIVRYGVAGVFALATVCLLDTYDHYYRFLASKNLRIQHDYFSGHTSRGVVKEAYGNMPENLLIESNRVMLKNIGFLQTQRLGIFSQTFSHRVGDTLPAPGAWLACPVSQIRFWGEDHADGVYMVAGMLNTSAKLEPSFYVLNADQRVMGISALAIPPLFTAQPADYKFNVPLLYHKERDRTITLLFLNRDGSEYCRLNPVLETSRKQAGVSL